MEMMDCLKTLTVMCLLGILCIGCNHSSVETEPNPIPNPVPAPNTAAYKLADIDLLAGSYGKGLRLMSVWSQDVHLDGTSGTWNYNYSDTLFPPTSYCFHSTFNSVKFDSTRPTGTGAGFISHNWLNSDSALMIAEQNGGSLFRTQNPHYKIAASVGIPVVPNAKTCWYITYQSIDNTNSLMLRIDANSGVVIARYP
jgi:hypothetical protein